MAEIKEIHGNIFNTQCHVLVNTVNCVGVMGAGIALECRYRFNGMFEFYKEFCDSGDMQPGKLLLYRETSPNILCFPTKFHWKDPSKIEYIERGLEKFSNTYKDKSIFTIALPHIGCSNGGLDWDRDVQDLVYRYLSDLDNLYVEIYSYDPDANDPLYNELAEALRDMRPKDISEAVGLRTKEARVLSSAVMSGEIHSMVGLQNCRGLGKKSLPRIHDFIEKYRSGSWHKQKGFGF